MRGYAYIEELFTNVLLKSTAIAGRFHVSARHGMEINSDQLGEVLKDMPAPSKGPKYPLCLMMPPRSFGSFTAKQGEWLRYKIDLFFLTGTYYTGANQVKNVNSSTQTSAHTILQDWHDMKRCAMSFLRVLARIEREKGLIQSSFRLDQADRVIDPVSLIGVDRASGVRLGFSCSLFVGCELEDYTDEGINSIILPAVDPHPEHKL